MKKIVFINRYFYPDHSATSQLLSDLAFHLAGTGHEVVVVTSRLCYDDPQKQFAARESVRGVQVERVWTSRFGRQRLLTRSVDYLTFYFSAFWRLLCLVRSGDTLVAKTDPPLISAVGALVARLKGARLLNWVQDVFPDVAVALGLIKSGGLLGRSLSFLSAWSYKAASCNVVIGERMAARLSASGVDAGKNRVIPNWADGGAVVPMLAATNSLRSQWGLADKFVVMYSGNMGRAHDFATILGAAALLQHDPRFVFLFVGGGNQRGPLGAEATRRNMTNVQFRPYQPRERLGESLSVGDAHLISLRPELEGLIVPSKFYGVLAVGRPVLFVGATDGDIAIQVGRADCGIVIGQGDEQHLAQALLRLADSPAECARLGSNGRSLLAGNLSQDAALAAWEKALN